MEIKSRPGDPVVVELSPSDRLRLAIRQALNFGRKPADQIVREFVREEVLRLRG